MLSIINNNGTDIVDILNTRYTKTEVDTLISTSYNKAETGNLLNQKVNTSDNNVISGSLEANVFRCGEITTINGDDLNALTLTQLTANQSIIDLRTEESFANLYLKVKGFSYIGLPTTNNIALYKDTTIDGSLTAGNTTINGDLTVTGNLTYNGGSSSGSYTKTEIYGKLFFKVNQSYGEVHGKLRINGGLEASVENPLYVKTSATHTNYWTLAAFHQLIAHSGSWIQFSREGIADTWQTGIDSDNSYVTRASDATNVVTVNQNGNTTISGNLDVDGIMNATQINLTNGVWDKFPVAITNTGANWFQGEYIATANEVGCLFRYRTSGSSTYWWSGVWGSNTNDFNI